MAERFDKDAELMLRFQAGDESCFEELVERHKQRVFNTVYRFLGGSPDAEDIAQEIFIRIYRARKTYKASARFTTWLYAVCRNTCLKQLRKHPPATVALSDETGRPDTPVAPPIADTRTPSPLEAALHSEQALVVKKAVDALPESQKMAVILHRYEHLSYREIAEAMGCSVQAVKARLHRARVNLKEKLAGYLEL